MIDEEEGKANFMYTGKINCKNFCGLLDGFFTGTITEKEGPKEVTTTFSEDASGDMPCIFARINGSVNGEFAGLVKLATIFSDDPEILYSETFAFLMNAPMRMTPVEQFGFTAEAIDWLKNARILLLDDIIRIADDQKLGEIITHPEVRSDVNAVLTKIGYYDQ